MRRVLCNGVLACLAIAMILGYSRNTIAQSEPADGPKRLRPDANLDLRVPKLPPELEQVLQDWEVKSGRIKRLQGEHIRTEYNIVFEVEKRTEGQFYYEAPDKGRIEVKPSKVASTQREDPERLGKSGKPFRVEPGDPEHWICDGETITRVNGKDKTYQEIPIPEESRGDNIINSSLPFLFGMPAEKAKLRYQFDFIHPPKQTAPNVWLRAKPNWQQDARNFREAQIILDTETYLPTAVKLIDPGGNMETVYQFRTMKINREPRFFEKLFGGGRDKDPFHPELKGYQKVDIAVGPPAGGAEAPPPVQTADNPPAHADAVPVPQLIGLRKDEAINLAEQLGLKPKLYLGEPASNPTLIHVVYQQVPKPLQLVSKGDVVNIRLYDEPGGQKPGN